MKQLYQQLPEKQQHLACHCLPADKIMHSTNPQTLSLKHIYCIDTSVLLENIPLVIFRKTTSGTRVVYFPQSHMWVYQWRNFSNFPLLFYHRKQSLSVIFYKQKLVLHFDLADLVNTKTTITLKVDAQCKIHVYYLTLWLSVQYPHLPHWDSSWM